MIFAMLIVVTGLAAQASKPVAVAEKYQAMMDEYLKALKESDAVFHKAETDEERQTIRTIFHRWRNKFVVRLLAFAETHPKDKEAIDALFFVLHFDTHAEPSDADRAIRILLKDHVTSDRIGSLLRMLAGHHRFSFAEKPLRQVLAKNPHPAIQAHACLSLGQLINEKAARCPPEQATKLTAEAEELFERVVTKYADVKDIKAVAKRYADVKAVREQARVELYQIRHLSVGKTMPDIKGKDSDDMEFKLSDYRGKVVVLTFWAKWCPACMKMVPHERSLVKRLRGKPFALVGVNLDPSREICKKCEEKNQMTWRSFFDGRDGPIRRAHNLKSMPTIYVLDARGVIRYKDVRGEAMDRAVDQLLTELEKGSRK